MIFSYQKPLSGKKVGVVFGSFAPLHQGHLDLIYRAKKENDGGAIVIVCGYDGEIIVNDDNEWECPQCHNKDHSKMNVTRRTCGYLGENFWNVGKTKEIKSRVLHI